MKFLIITLLAIAVNARPSENQSEDYLPRAIRENEQSMVELPPSKEQTPLSFASQAPLSFASQIKPVEFQYLVPLDSTADVSEQHYKYELEHDPKEEEVDVVEEVKVPAKVDYEALLRRYFGPKSKYSYDKDQVGIPGKERRYRREAAPGSGSQSSASSSSYSSHDSPIVFGSAGLDGGFGDFGNQGGFGSNFGQAGGFGGFGGAQDGAYSGGYGGGLQGFGGGASASSHSSSQGGNGGGYNRGGYEGSIHDDGNILLRFGSDDGGGSQTRGVYSGASSSIDSTGKRTHTVQAGKF